MTNPTPLSTAAAEEEPHGPTWDFLSEMGKSIEHLKLTDGKRELVKAAFRACIASAQIKYPKAFYPDASEHLRQPVAGDASDLVKALEGEQKAIDTILEKGRWLMSEPYLSGARVTVGTDNMKDAGDIQKAFAELKKSALTRHRQGEKG